MAEELVKWTEKMETLHPGFHFDFSEMEKLEK